MGGHVHDAKITGYTEDGIPVKAPPEQHGGKEGALTAQHTREIPGVHAGLVATQCTAQADRLDGPVWGSELRDHRNTVIFMTDLSCQGRCYVWLK